MARTSPGLHAPAVAYARYGLLVFAGLILLGVWRRRRASDRELAAAVWAGAGILLAVALNQPVAALVAEARPYAVHPAALTLVDRTTDWSFSSDHSVMAGAAAVGLLLVAERLGAVALAAAVLMADTRVYVGAHYPHDVLAGPTRPTTRHTSVPSPRSSGSDHVSADAARVHPGAGVSR